MLVNCALRRWSCAGYPGACRVTGVWGRTQMCSDSQRPVTLERIGENKRIAVLRINHPKVNAMSRSLVDNLNHAFAELENDDCTQVVILQSALDRIFCAGADLKERKAMNDEESSLFVQYARRTFSRMERLPQAVIGCVDGIALGGGLELALACDLRVGSENATLGLIETSLAIIPGAGGTQRLPLVVGMPLAKELILTARRFDGRYAHRVGILNHVTEGSSFGKALELAEEIVANGPIATRAAKSAINTSFAATDNMMANEKSGYDCVIGTLDRVEAMQAFAEKRKPHFNGN